MDKSEIIKAVIEKEYQISPEAVELIKSSNSPECLLKYVLSTVRVAKAYLKSSNRTLGEFIPITAPDRAEIPATPDPAARFKDYKGGAAIQQGEVFDPTPQNIEARVIRATLPNGLKLVMFPKKTRGGTVAATMTSASATRSRCSANPPRAPWPGPADARHHEQNRQQIQDETDRLKAQINVTGHSSPSVAPARWRRTSPIRCASPANYCASPPSPKPNSSRSASSASPGRERQERAQYPGIARHEPPYEPATRAATCAIPLPSMKRSRTGRRSRSTTSQILRAVLWRR